MNMFIHASLYIYIYVHQGALHPHSHPAEQTPGIHIYVYIYVYIYIYNLQLLRSYPSSFAPRIYAFMYIGRVGHGTCRERSCRCAAPQPIGSAAVNRFLSQREALR